MAQLPLDELRDRIRAFVANSPLGAVIRDVSVELPMESNDDDVVRVTLTLVDPDRVDRREMARLVRAIEDRVGESDDRFPSVRFAEAA